MFSFHTRTRSLIPVGDIDKTVQTSHNPQSARESFDVEEQDDPYRSPQSWRSFLLIYLLFLAEAIMASSLTSQIAVLLPSDSECLSMNTSFLRSILQAAYFFGGAAGLAWGWSTDRVGRRSVALFGLYAMCVCCASMSFARSFAAFAVLRFVAGIVSSAVNVSGLAMLADSTHGSRNRVHIVARIPMIMVCGSLGPLATEFAKDFAGDDTFGPFLQYLSGQIICASIVGSITIVETIWLKETFLAQSSEASSHHGMESEKAAFLGQSLPSHSQESLPLSIADSTARPSHIAISEMVSAPSVVVLLTSFSVLSMHSSTFETLLPHIGHGPSTNLGLGISCASVGPITLIVQTLTAYAIFRALPRMVSKFGILRLYRYISLIFPGLYVVVPTVGIVLGLLGAGSLVSATVSIIAMSLKAVLSSSAGVLAILLVLSAAPDAFSTGTLVGVMYISQFFKALAVGISGISFYLADDYSMIMVNLALWASLATIAFVGASLTWRMRETPRVGADIPPECLVWEDMFDLSEDDDGFP